MSKIGAALSKNLEVQQENEQNIHIKDLPWQRLKDEAEGLGKRARARSAAASRAGYEGLKEVDTEALKVATSKRTQEELNIITHSASLAGWTGEKLHEIGWADEAKCEICMQPETDSLHSQWKCAEICKRRQDTYMKHIDTVDCLLHLLLGMPGMMSSRMDTTF